MMEKGLTRFLRYPLSDLGEITQSSLSGRAQGVWVHLAGPAVRVSAAWLTGQCYSETQLSLQSSVSICSLSVILCSSRTRKKLCYTVHFNIQNHVSNTCVCGQPS